VSCNYTTSSFYTCRHYSTLYISRLGKSYPRRNRTPSLDPHNTLSTPHQHLWCSCTWRWMYSPRKANTHHPSYHSIVRCTMKLNRAWAMMWTSINSTINLTPSCLVSVGHGPADDLGWAFVAYTTCCSMSLSSPRPGDSSQMSISATYQKNVDKQPWSIWCSHYWQGPPVH